MQPAMSFPWGEVIRFPGRCTQTEEPILAAARLIQLGASEASRNEPVTKLKVDGTPNTVIRVLTFRDEWEGEWAQFIRNPVRQILQTLPELRSNEEKTTNRS